MHTIRHASEKDIALIRNLSLEIWPHTYAHILSPAQLDYMLGMIYSEKALRIQFEEGQKFIIIYDEGIPLGFASYGLIETGIFKLHKLYILPIHQGRGIGKFVIDQIVNDIKPSGARQLILNVNRNNKAKTFYEKLGFEILSTEDVDIGGGYYMNDYIMALNLEKSY